MILRHGPNYRVFVAPAALLAVAASLASPVAAHAVLLRSTPPAGQTLVQAPSEVQLLFSEPLNPSFSGVTVVNETGHVVDLGDGHVLPGRENEMAVSLQPALPRGVYTVRWRTFSTIDVHPDGGDYNLYLGVAPPGVGETAAGAGASVYAPPLETTLARWWLYLAVSLLAGSLAVVC